MGKIHWPLKMSWQGTFQMILTIVPVNGMLHVSWFASVSNWTYFIIVQLLCKYFVTTLFPEWSGTANCPSLLWIDLISGINYSLLQLYPLELRVELWMPSKSMTDGWKRSSCWKWRCQTFYSSTQTFAFPLFNNRLWTWWRKCLLKVSVNDCIHRTKNN